MKASKKRRIASRKERKHCEPWQVLHAQSLAHSLEEPVAVPGLMGLRGRPVFELQSGRLSHRC